MSEDYNSFRWMKLHNQKKVLELLHQEKLISRIDIARRSNLQKQTVTNIVKELLTYQFVIEEAVLAKEGVGRKPVLLRLLRENLFAIGVEVTKSYLSGVVMDYNQTVIYQHKITFPIPFLSNETLSQRDALLQLLVHLIDLLLEHVPHAGKNLGICVGIQGIIDPSKGEVIHSPYLGWHHVAVKQWLAARYSVPIYVENNVRAFARGEVWSRTVENSVDLSHVLCIYLDEGVGAALVMNGQVYTGADYYAGEMGHMKINLDGPLCYCGQRGCLEAYVSVQRIMVELNLTGQSFTETISRLENGDVAALAILEEVGRHIGFVIGNVLNLLNSGAVIIGGELTMASRWFQSSLNRSLDHTTIATVRDTPIYYSDYSRNNCALGAAALVFQEWLLQSGAGKG